MLYGGKGISSRAWETGLTNRAIVRSTNESKHFGLGEGISDQTRRAKESKRDKERERERERDAHIYTHISTCTCVQSGERGRFIRVWWTNISFWHERNTWRVAIASSTPSISLIRLGTRFECSLSLSTTSLSKSVRARSSMRNFRTVWHTWVAITRVPFESTRELVVGSELARGSFAYGYGDCP